MPDLHASAPTGARITAVSDPQVSISCGRSAVIAGRITWKCYLRPSAATTSSGFCQAQFISEICGKGFIHHKVARGETLTTVTASYETPSADALFNHKYNKTLKFIRVTPTNVVAGDTVPIPREMTAKPILASKYL